MLPVSLDCDTFGIEMTTEPPGTPLAKARRKREFAVIAKAREEPGGGVAKTLASIAAPRGGRGQGRCPSRAIHPREFVLAPFRAPAEFAGGARMEFGSKQVLPAPARLIRQAPPREMKDLMNQDALEIAGDAQGFRIDQNETPGDGGRGKMGSKRSAQLHSNGTAGQAWQRHLWFLRLCLPRRAGGQEKFRLEDDRREALVEFGCEVLDVFVADFRSDGLAHLVNRLKRLFVSTNDI